MESSKYQNAFYETLRTSDRNIGLDAVAGSGKSTTLQKGVSCLPVESKILMLAFNKDIVTSLQARMAGCEQKPTVATINSFGWRACRDAEPGVELEPDKTENIFKTYFDMDDFKQRSQFYRSKNAVKQMVVLLKANCCFTTPTVDEIETVADNYGITCNSKLVPMIQEVYARSINLTAIMDFSDQVFMPLRHGYAIPEYDVGLVDEGQDLTRMAQDLAIRACKRVVVVGDKRQAIYGFTGADPKSLPNMICKLAAVELPLSICYRCPKSVIREAQKIVPHIEPWDQAPEGKVDRIKDGEWQKKVEPNDFVLCRLTAPLVSECLKMIREGRRAMVKGRDIGQQIIMLIDRLGVNNRDSTRRLHDALQKYEMEELERLSRANREELIVALQDRVSTLSVLLESSTDVQGVKNRIGEIFSDNVSGIIFSTAHKSKGLEAPRVFILKPELMPYPRAELPWQVEQEMNLKYVATTRVKFGSGTDGELYYIES